MALTTEKRQARRFPLAWPVGFPGGHGVTRNLSRSGVYFATLQYIPEGCTMRLVILPRHVVNAPGRLACEGIVVRVTEESQGYGIAVRLAAVRFEFEGAARTKSNITMRSGGPHDPSTQFFNHNIEESSHENVSINASRLEKQAYKPNDRDRGSVGTAVFESSDISGGNMAVIGGTIDGSGKGGC